MLTILAVFKRYYNNLPTAATRSGRWTQLGLKWFVNFLAPNSSEAHPCIPHVARSTVQVIVSRVVVSGDFADGKALLSVMFEVAATVLPQVDRWIVRGSWAGAVDMVGSTTCRFSGDPTIFRLTCVMRGIK